MKQIVQSDDVQSRALSGAVVMTSMRGYLSSVLATTAARQFARLAAEGSTRIWIVDIVELTGFDPKAVLIGNRWWRKFKKLGGSEVILVSQSSAYRMTAATLGFGAGIRVRALAALPEALAVAGLDSKMAQVADRHIGAVPVRDP